MISDIDNPKPEDPLANEANLIATLGLSEGTFEQEDQIDPEIALQTLLSDTSLSQLVLRRNDGGGESITGYFRLKLQPGQQRVSWHIPVSPPLAEVPAGSAEPIDCPDARVRFTNIQRFGARAELILPAPTETDQVVLVLVSLSAN